MFYRNLHNLYYILNKMKKRGSMVADVNGTRTSNCNMKPQSFQITEIIISVIKIKLMYYWKLYLEINLEICSV